MNSVTVFLDFANIDRAVRDRNERIDYEDLLQYLSADRNLQEAFCYVPIDPRAPTIQDGMIEELWANGYLVRSKIGSCTDTSYKCNFDVEMAIEMMRVGHTFKPDVVVLASGDIDMVPAMEALRAMGIRVEVAGFLANTARDLILKCSGFINLEHYFQDNNVQDNNMIDDDESNNQIKQEDEQALFEYDEE